MLRSRVPTVAGEELGLDSLGFPDQDRGVGVVLLHDGVGLLEELSVIAIRR